MQHAPCCIIQYDTVGSRWRCSYLSFRSRPQLWTIRCTSLPWMKTSMFLICLINLACFETGFHLCCCACTTLQTTAEGRSQVCAKQCGNWAHNQSYGKLKSRTLNTDVPLRILSLHFTSQHSLQRLRTPLPPSLTCMSTKWGKSLPLQSLQRERNKVRRCGSTLRVSSIHPVLFVRVFFLLCYLLGALVLQRFDIIPVLVPTCKSLPHHGFWARPSDAELSRSLDD